MPSAAVSITPHATLTVDLAALAHNYDLLAARAAPVALAAVVKADAYGLGAIQVVETLAARGCRHFFVAHLIEAVPLVDVIPADASLFVLNGLDAGNEAACAALNIVPVLNCLDQLRLWGAEARRLGRPLPAVLQVDTGMARLGLSVQELAELHADPALLADIPLTLLMSHFARADEPDAAANSAQIAAFAAAARHFPGVPRALSNSGGLFLNGIAQDVARTGIALYGGAPQLGVANPMAPVVHLSARIVQTRTVPANTPVGYGGTWTAPEPRRIATIGVGYADGWPRSLSNRGSAFINGVRVPVVGRVSMDSITLDVSALPEGACHPGAAVELLGEHQTIDDVARDAGTISYEILTQLGRRYARVTRPAASHAQAKQAVSA